MNQRCAGVPIDAWECLESGGNIPMALVTQVIKHKQFKPLKGDRSFCIGCIRELL